MANSDKPSAADVSARPDAEKSAKKRVKIKELLAQAPKTRGRPRDLDEDIRVFFNTTFNKTLAAPKPDAQKEKRPYKKRAQPSAKKKERPKGTPGRRRDPNVDIRIFFDKAFKQTFTPLKSDKAKTSSAQKTRERIRTPRNPVTDFFESTNVFKRPFKRGRHATILRPWEESAFKYAPDASKTLYAPHNKTERQFLLYTEEVRPQPEIIRRDVQPPPHFEPPSTFTKEDAAIAEAYRSTLKENTALTKKALTSPFYLWLIKENRQIAGQAQMDRLTLALKSKGCPVHPLSMFEYKALREQSLNQAKKTQSHRPPSHNNYHCLHGLRR
ncbi:MAG: hypothetical protein WC464_00770 [Bdellovibrionales bacterium]